MAMDGRLTGGGPEQWARGRQAFNQQKSWEKQGVFLIHWGCSWRQNSDWPVG